MKRCGHHINLNVLQKGVWAHLTEMVSQRCSRTCYDTGALVKPLELPHVLLLPSMEAPYPTGALVINNGNQPTPTNLPALASNMGEGLPFCCHTKPHTRDPDNKCRGTDICTNGKCA